ncbi:MAG: multidrug efflux SMR transporter [Hyphomonadaceae bacterium]
MSIHWWALVLAGVFEIAWAAGFKFAFRSNHLISAAVVTAMAASFYFLWFAMRAIPIGTAYAVWTGIGAAGAATIGLLFLGEPATALRLICITLIIAGVVGLKIAAG